MSVLVCALALACATPARAAGLIPRRATVIILLGSHVVRSAPAAGAKLIASVAGVRPITGERTALPLLGSRPDRRGLVWLRVRLPGRVLGATRPAPRSGWIRATHTRRTTTAWHLVVDLRGRRLLAYRDSARIRAFRAIVGKPATPTPPGEFFVEENVRLSPGLVGAPFALAMSARSRVIQEFDGGPGQIAVHGLGNVGGRLGTAASHGCIRLADADVAWLAARIGPGVPVTVRTDAP